MSSPEQNLISSSPQLIPSSGGTWAATGATALSHIPATYITVTALLLPFQWINTLYAAAPSHSTACCRCVKQQRRCRALQENSNNSHRPVWLITMETAMRLKVIWRWCVSQTLRTEEWPASLSLLYARYVVKGKLDLSLLFLLCRREQHLLQPEIQKI